jgi:hypothetical protein
MKMRAKFQLILVGSILFSAMVLAQTEKLKPFVLGVEPRQADLEQAATAVTEGLQQQGFEVAGSYAPYPNAKVIVVTNEALKANAAKSDFGGYGAVLRVAVTKVKDKIQVSYTNPPYWAAAYRLQGNLEDVKAKIESALGKQAEYGSKDGIKEKSLRKYNYMVGMAKFDSLGDHEIAAFKTHQEALDAVESGLAADRAGVTRVYRVDIPGKEESVFGVAIAKGKGADRHIMDTIDFADVKSTAHLPYEVLVSGSKVYHLYAKFRIAISFPDLGMVGSNSFFSIMSAPGAIKDALTDTVTSASGK